MPVGDGGTGTVDRVAAERTTLLIGDYLGQRVEATGRKEGYAVMAWSNAAKALSKPERMV